MCHLFWKIGQPTELCSSCSNSTSVSQGGVMYGLYLHRQWRTERCVLNQDVILVETGSLLLVETGSSTKLDRELDLQGVSEHTPFGLRNCTNISGCLPNLLWVEGGLSWSPRCQRGLTFDVCVESCDDRKVTDSKLFDVGSSFSCAWKWNSGAPVWIPTCETIHVHLGSWHEYNRQ